MKWLIGIGVSLLLALIGYLSCRFNVPAENVAILIKHTGIDSSNDETIAKDAQHKGIQLNVLTEGRYYYNPYVWEVEMMPSIVVPQGKVGVLIKHFGKQTDGRLLAKDDERGIALQELKPGRYPEYSNKYAYTVELHNATTVPPGYRGVITINNGKLNESYAVVVNDGERGVQTTSLTEGTYYYNPYHKVINLVDCRQKTVSLDDDHDMGFPSSDGFWIHIDGYIRYRIDPEKAASVYVTYNDNDNGDEIADEIRSKIIMPQARSFCRLAGAIYTSRELVDGKIREKFQADFVKRMTTYCKPLGVIIEAANFTDISPPTVVTDQLSQREIAHQKQQQFNREIEQQKSQAKLAAQNALKLQQAKLIQAEQEIIELKTTAQQEQQIALTKANERKDIAAKKLAATKDKAAAIVASGKAEANIIKQQTEAEVAGLKASVTAFKGDSTALANKELLNKLAPNYKAITINTADSPLMKPFESTKKGKE